MGHSCDTYEFFEVSGDELGAVITPEWRNLLALWKEPVLGLFDSKPEGIRINQITAEHAKEFHEKLKARGMATTTIHKRIQFARQFMHDAVDWKIIDENPFSKVRTQRSTVKVNEFVPREMVDKLMKKANPVWQVILGLSRYPVFLNHRTHRTHGNKSSLLPQLGYRRENNVKKANFPAIRTNKPPARA